MHFAITFAADKIVVDSGSQSSAGSICALMTTRLAFDEAIIADHCVETILFDLIYLWNLSAVKK